MNEEQKTKEKQTTLIRYSDCDNIVKQVEAKEILIDAKFDSIVIHFESTSGESKKYFLRRTKKDRLVLT